MSTGKSLTNRFLHSCWLLLAGFVILLALVVSAGRMLIPLTEQYSDRLVELVSKELGRPVMIGSFSADWSGLLPTLSLKDITLLTEDGSQAWMHLSAINVSVALVGSLARGGVDPVVIDLVGAEFTVERTEQNTLSVWGLKVPSNTISTLGSVLAWLMERERIRIVDSHLTWVDPGLHPEPLSLSHFNMWLMEKGEGNRLYGDFRLAGPKKQRFTFILDLIGDINQPNQLKHKVFLESQFELGELQSREWLKNLEVSEGQIALRLWAEGKGDQLSNLKGDVHVSNLSWDFESVTPGVSGVSRVKSKQLIRQLGGRFFWAKQEQGWRLDVENLIFAGRYQGWPSTSFSLRQLHQQDDPAEMYSGAVGYLNVRDIRELLQNNIALPDSVSKLLSGLKPEGDLHDLVFSARRNGDVFSQVKVSSGFRDLSVKNWNQIPAISGLDGEFSLTPGGGVIGIDSGKGTVHLPRLGLEPLDVQRLSGQVKLDHVENVWRLESQRLQLSNADASVDARFVLEIPEQGGAPFLDLRVGFNHGVVAQTRHYVPAAIMPKKVVQWLEPAFLGGRVTGGGLLYFGRLNDYPFKKFQGTFDVIVDVEDASMNYGSSWPEVNKMWGQVRFRDRSLGCTIASSKTLGVHVGPVEVAIKRLGSNAILEIDGKAEGQVKSMLQFLRQTPASGKYAEFLQNVQGKGVNQIGIGIDLPLGKGPEHLKLEGNVKFLQSEISLPRWQQEFNQLEGNLTFKFDDSQLRFEPSTFDGKFKQKPAKFEVRSQYESSRGWSTALTLQTRNGIKNLLPEGVLTDFADLFPGESDWSIGLNTRPTADQKSLGQATLTVSSDLEGIAIQLPDGYSKPEQQAVEFDFKSQLSEKGLGQVSINYNNQVQTVFDLTTQDSVDTVGMPNKMAIHFGDQQPLLTDVSGIEVTGNIPAFTWSSWLQWLSENKSADKPGLMPLLTRIDIALGRLDFFGHNFHDISVHMNRQDQDWLFAFNGEEIEGSMQLPMELDRTALVKLDLKRLQLLHVEQQTDITPYDPRLLPAIDVHSDQLLYNDMGSGELDLRLAPTPGGVAMDQFHFVSEHLKLTGNGVWVVDDQGHHTRFSMQAKSSNLGRVLSAAKYKDAIENGRLVGDMDLDWPGAPSQFDWERVNGQVHMRIKDGSLLDIDPGGGRVFGLLSFQALPRRLKLDFSDIFDKGFGFDRIEGDFVIAEGDAFTNDLELTGTSATLQMSGRTGLADKDYDQRVLVTPKISSAIPLVGGLAGGPTVAIGLWVADKIFGGQIDQMTQIEYSISGSWESPEIKRIGGDPDLPESEEYDFEEDW